MKPEEKIQRAIVEFMRTVGFSVWDTSQGYRKERGGTRMTPGIPDLVICGHGHTIFVEVKTPKGKLTVYQHVFRSDWTKNGGTALVWRSSVEAFDWCVAQGIIEEGPAAI